jgi:phosphoribosylformylglycinamidine synthase
MALAGGIGCSTNFFKYAEAFGEDQGRYVIEVTYEAESSVIELAHKAGIAAQRIGFTHGSAIGYDNGSKGGDIPLADLRAAHEGFFPALMQGEL